MQGWPLYEGKTLHQWLDAGYQDSARVLYEIGPPAADSIFVKLKCEHPQDGLWGCYRCSSPWLPLGRAHGTICQHEAKPGFPNDIIRQDLPLESAAALRVA